jgi:hypothetical protein
LLRRFRRKKLRFLLLVHSVPTATIRRFPPAETIPHHNPYRPANPGRARLPQQQQQQLKGGQTTLMPKALQSSSGASETE